MTIGKTTQTRVEELDRQHRPGARWRRNRNVACRDGNDIEMDCAITTSHFVARTKTPILATIFSISFLLSSPAAEDELARLNAVSKELISEANYYAHQLRLSESVANAEPAVKVKANPPTIGGLGLVETEEFIFSFPGHDQKPLTNSCGTQWFLEPGKLAYIIRKKPFPLLSFEVGSDSREMQRRLAGLRSGIDTNSAYALATQWLAAVEIDTEALEKKYLPRSVQLFYDENQSSSKSPEAKPPAAAKIKRLPIFDVTWGGEADCDPPVWIQINGVTKELIHLRMEDTRFSKHRPLTLRNTIGTAKKP